MAGCEEINDITTCPVCFETYDLNGDHIPRILPCFHTLCEKCLVELLQDEESLLCPECRVKHSADNGLKAFPQNKYIVEHIRKIKEIQENKFKKCEEHSRDHSLFCQNAECKRPICQLCMIKEHRSHEVEDMAHVLRGKFSTLVGRIDSMVKQVEHNKNLFVLTGAEVEKLYQPCIKNIEECRDKSIEMLHGMFERKIQAIKDSSNKTKTDIEKDIKLTDEKLAFLDNIRKTTTESKSTLEDFAKIEELIDDIAMKENASDSVKTYLYPSYVYDRDCYERASKMIGNTHFNGIYEVVMQRTKGSDSNKQIEKNIKKRRTDPFSFEGNYYCQTVSLLFQVV